jgi:hypothetical protein
MSTFKNIQGRNIRSYTTNPDNPLEGQMWYNQTELKLKGVTASGAWSSTSPMINSVQYRGGGGTPTAMFAAGGSLSTNLTEEYNGSGWSAGGNIGTARYEMGSAGTLTAGLIFGGYNNPPASTKADTEEYNGTSWSEQNNLNTARYSQGGFGIQTAAVYSSGFNPSSLQTDTEEYNGTSWSEGNNPAQARYDVGTGGTLTAGIIFGGGGATAPVVYANTELYDGTNWTAGPAMNTARSTLGGSGTQTAAIGFGGRSTPVVAITEQFDGTSWTEVGDLATARRNITANRSNTGNSEAIAAGGSPGSGTVTLVEQWNFTANTITAAAWSAGANFPTSSSQVSGAGSRDAGLGIGGYPEGGSPTGKSYEYNGVAWSSEATLNPSTGTQGVQAAAGTQTACINAQNTTPAPPYVYTAAGEYDGSSWSNATARPTDNYSNAACGTQTAGLFFGGAASGTSMSSATLSYDGTNWTAEESLSTARRDLAGSGTATAGLATGGYSNPPATYLANTEEYGGESWTAGGSLLVATGFGRSSGTQGDAIFFGGGVPANTSASFRYDGTSWATAPSLSTARQLFGSGATSPVGAAWGAAGYYPGSSPNRTNTTEHFNVETTSTNIVDITTS